MPLGLSQVLAAQGLTAPGASVMPSPAAMAMPAGAVPVDPSTVAGPAGGGFFGGMDPKNMLALMQAFGGLKMPTPVVPPTDTIRPPAPVAPQGANPAAIASTANTSAIASLLAAGLRPQSVSSLGQLMLPGGR